MKSIVFEHSYGAVLAELERRLREPAPGRVQLLTGPRQVGKTTLLGEIEKQWKGKALYLAADAPEASLPGWWERQWQRAHGGIAHGKVSDEFPWAEPLGGGARRSVAATT
jgi:hypothetical protein